jgi:hypothetical protein
LSEFNRYLKDKEIQNNINFMKKQLFIRQKWNTVYMAAFVILFSCSHSQGTNPTDDQVTCIITDKSALEDIAIFPSDNPLNQNISSSPVDTRSEAIIQLIGSVGLHPDFGSGQWEGVPIGIPFILVCKTQTKIPVLFRANDYDGNYGSESDAGPYPIPLTAPIEGNGAGGDSHVLAVDLDNKVLYEMYNARAGANGWEASGGVIWDLKTNATRPEGWTSADASGMAILPLLVRYDEVLKGTIDHAIRFTLSNKKTMKAYTAPASHKSSGANTDINAPTPYGMRLRLKAGYDISSFSKTNQVILTAMKNYGLIFSDIGSDMFISGAPDDRWNNDDLSQLKKITASDFEVIKMGEIVGI